MARAGSPGVRRDKGEERAVARERVARLIQLADEGARAGRIDRADRYVQLAWLVKTKYQLRGSGIEARICRSCQAFLAPGRTARVRLTGGKRSVTCLACGATRRKLLRPAAPGTP